MSQNNPKLPCENCKLQTDRCSTDCQRLYEFLRWTDKNKAQIMSKEPVYGKRELTFDPNVLTIISDEIEANLAGGSSTFATLISQGLDHGALDLSFLKPHEAELYELYHLQQLSAQQIAEMWQITSHAVHCRLTRIRKKLIKNYLN